MTETTLQRNDEVIEADIDGDKVMMDIESGNYYGLDPVACRIWEILATPMTANQVAEQLIHEFDVSLEQCKTDIQPFIEDMITNQLLKTDA